MDPLLINEVSHNSVIYGLTMLPGSKARAMGGPDWDRDRKADMSVIKAWAPDVLITCSPESEKEEYTSIKYYLQLHAHLHQSSPVSGNLTEEDLDRDALVHLHTQIKGWSKDRPQRVLLISMRGLQRAGTLAGILLRLDGMDAEAAITALNAARQFAVSTILQRHLITDTRPETRPLATMKRRNRELAPPGIMEAKDAAGWIHRRNVNDMSSGQALEVLAKSRGWANWSTMSAALRGPGLPYPAHAPLAKELHDVLGLSSGKPEDMIRAWKELTSFPLHVEVNDIKTNILRWIEVNGQACFALHAARGVRVGADALRRAFFWDSFCVYVRAVAHEEITGDVADMVMEITKSIPGFSVDLALAGAEQSERAKERMSFYSLNVTKVIGDLIDEARGDRSDSGRLRA